MLENYGGGDQTKLTSLEDILNSESSYYKLPSEFFEKILEYEVNLKEKFDPKIFFELINYYSKAIGFYESINDPKFIIYNQALNYLFEKPEARKFMEGKDLGKEFRKKEIIKRFKQCDKIVTEEKVKIFIEKRTNAENIKSSIDNLYNKDIEKQKNSFQKKLEEKKLKYKDKYKNREKEKNENVDGDNEIKEIKASNESENKENIVNNEAGEAGNNAIKENEKEGDEKKEEKINDDEFNIDDGGELLDVDNGDEEQEEISEIDFNLDDVMELVNIAKEEHKENKNNDKKENNDNNDNNDNKENNENKENKNNENNNNEKNNEKKDTEEELKSNSTKNTLSLKKSLKRTNKTRFFEKMLENWDNYFDGYYEYFINNNIDIILKDFEDSEKEISAKVCESSVNYLNQIKDMEYLLENKDNDESYRKEIGNIVKQLNNEKNDNIKKILTENEDKLKKIDNKYIINNTILKEKFKLDTTKLLNSFIFK